MSWAQRVLRLIARRPTAGRHAWCDQGSQCNQYPPELRTHHGGPPYRIQLSLENERLTRSVTVEDAPAAMYTSPPAPVRLNPPPVLAAPQ